MTEDEIFLLDQIAHPVFVLEPDDQGTPRYAAFNRAAREVLERPVPDLIGKTALELYGGRKGRVAYDRHLAVMRDGQRMNHQIILPIAGQDRMIRTTLQPVTSPSGAVTRIVGTSTDETARHRLRALRAEMDSKACDMEDFVHIAAHDLRAPMRHVATLAAMMREDFQDLSEDRLELIGVLEDVSAKTLDLIGAVLSHAQAGAAKAEQSRFSFAELVDELRKVIDPFETCDLTAPDGWIDGDRLALQIVLRNLFENAVKYAQPPDDTARPAIELTLEQRSGGTFALCLRDTGPGFDAYTLEHLADGAFSNEGGYGLMAVRRLVTERGGALHVANRADRRGSEITITLPGHWQEDGYGPAVAASGAR